jgi:hypothetical protein
MVFYYLFDCYMFRSYDHLQAEVYLLELTLLTTDALLVEEVGWGDVDWIGLAQDRDRWRALVNSVLNLRVP